MDDYITREDFQAYMERLLERLDIIEHKIDRLTTRKNCMNGDELLDTQDLCLLLKASKRTLQRYRRNGVLPFHFIEGKVYYKSSEIHDFIRNSYQPAKKKPKKPNRQKPDENENPTT
jgi:hypothetical protein